MVAEKIYIDFQILKTGDPNVLILCDTSEWAYIKNKPAIVEIILPTGKLITQPLAKNQNNIYNSSNLYLSNTSQRNALPDGVYDITVKGSPNDYCKNRKYIKTDKLKLELDDLYLALGPYIEDSSNIREYVYKVNFMIGSAEAAMRKNERTKAEQYYIEGRRLLDEYNTCKDC